VRAVLSVYDKTGLDEFAHGLVDLGFELVSTGGTHAYLARLGLPVRSVSDVTGFPEILDGRVKTLHPAIHGGLLARRDLPEHRAALNEQGIEPIDLLAVNLYPFEETVNRPGTSRDEALEQIDIGGPAMVRAAAKNFPHVIVVTNPERYAEILGALRRETVSDSMRRSLAAEAFQHVSTYDALVADYLRGPDLQYPRELTVPGRLVYPLRYGENPHQSAAAYLRPSATGSQDGVLSSVQLQGKELSYNNILDADAALQTTQGLSEPTCAIIKHTIPCGLAVRDTPADAFVAALASDPVSAFGGIVALNRPVDAPTAERIAGIFLEVVIAPGFDSEARRVLSAKKNLRLLELPKSAWEPGAESSLRTILGGFLVQESDSRIDDQSGWTVVTHSQLPDELRADLALAWHAIRYVKSNAIVLSKNRAVVGVGPGQPNRLDSVRIAIQRAGDRSRGSVLASDAFFPFADGVEEAILAGILAVIQPGGSVRDADVVAACNNAGIPMVFTGTRHFLH
jgi:phosphoribosylaminoimidazolecarboxamide formyltransferase / IMP cyclohydrolase